MTTSWVVSLDDRDALDAAVVGEKAAALARMKQADLPVPGGFVICADAFTRATADAKTRLLELFDANDQPTAQETSEAARQLISGLDLPAEIREAIIFAYQTLGRDAPVAVRSSGTAEDLAGASFAGQYDSYLNVFGGDSLIDAVKAVWTSLHSLHAIAYRERQGVSQVDASMAVLVQQQLDADAAGVMFTRDPVSGRKGRFIVNVAYGLGEGVVAGSVSADTFEIESGTFAIVEQTVVEKSRMWALRKTGGIEKQEVPQAARRTAALNATQLERLGRLGRSVTDIFGDDRDIEFALADGALHVLQARPVTGPGGAEEEFPVVWPDPADEEYAWVLFPYGRGPVYPLQEAANDAYARGMRRCFDDTGVSMARNSILLRFNGFQYGRSPPVGEAEVKERQRRHRERDQQYRERGASVYEAEIVPQAEDAFRRFNRFHALRHAALAELLEYLEASIEAYGRVMGDLHWRMAGAMRMDWPSVYREITGEPEIDSGVLLQAINNRTVQLIRRLRGLARLAQGDAELRGALRGRDYDHLSQAPIRGRPAVRRFRDRFRALLRDYGRRSGRGFGSATGFTEPTWNMNPSAPFDLIAAYAEQDIDELERTEAEARRERRQATRRLRRKLAGNQETLSSFNDGLAMAVDMVRRMEDHNHLMEQGVNGSLREAFFLIGEGMVREGLIEMPDDALHLTLDEIRTVVRADQHEDLRPLVRERAAQFEARSHMNPPQKLGRGELPPPEPPRPGTAPSKSSGLDGTVLRGTGASRGVCTGRARVFRPDDARPEVKKGDILVAQNAGPDWTPILPLLGGIVLDEGAIYQHAALIAREYRIPAVIQTREATKTIVDGQVIRVDGNRGIVELAPETTGGAAIG